MNWRKRISAADQLVCEFLKKDWGVSDKGRTERGNGRRTKQIPSCSSDPTRSSSKPSNTQKQDEKLLSYQSIIASTSIPLVRGFGPAALFAYLFFGENQGERPNFRPQRLCWNENDFAKLIGDLKEESKATTISLKYQHDLERAAY